MSNNILPTLIIAQALYHRYNEQQREQQREQEETRARIREVKERAEEEKRRKERAKYEAQKREADAQRLDDLRASKGEQWTADDLFWVVEKGEYYVMNSRPDMDNDGILTLGTSKDIIKALDEGANPNAVSKSGEIFSFSWLTSSSTKPKTSSFLNRGR